MTLALVINFAPDFSASGQRSRQAPRSQQASELTRPAVIAYALPAPWATELTCTSTGHQCHPKSLSAVAIFCAQPNGEWGSRGCWNPDSWVAQAGDARD